MRISDWSSDVCSSDLLGIEQRRSIRLVKQLGLEIEARRQVEIGVAGACEAVDAAVLAAAIWIARLRARQVRRPVAGNDRARVLAMQGGRELRRRLVVVEQPVVIEMFAGSRLHAPLRLGRRATPI